jgi:hypothetical protein
MQLTLNESEAAALRNLLHDWLPELRREHARTDLPSHEIRNELRSRIKVAERLLGELEQTVGATAH